MCTNYSCVCNVLREDSSAGLLVEFHQHVALLYVLGRIVVARHPLTIDALVEVEVACAALSIPPTAFTNLSAGAEGVNQEVVVIVWSSEHFSVGLPVR